MIEDRLDLDRTHDSRARSWITSANEPETDFPVQNLPFGVFRRSAAEAFRAGVAIGDRILDLTSPAALAALRQSSPAALGAASESTLNALAALEPDTLTALRHSIFDVLTTESRRAEIEPALVCMADAEFALPFSVGDFTDFYASIFHATRVGTMYRPLNPLMPNYKYVPVAYHGRSSTIVVDGTPVRRPRGQLRLGEDAPPVYDACRCLDYEAEVGFYVGRPTQGEVDIDAAPAHVFGFTVLNDWSARDIQTWEYQPLGPFLGKNFATTVSPWVVTLDALRPFRTHALVRADGDPSPLPHLASAHDREHGGVAVGIEVSIRSERMRNEGLPPLRLSRSSFADSYWTFSQMLTHHASNGCVLRSGDLMGSGTMSGPGDNPTMWGSLVELSHNGRDPLSLTTGETRTFIVDGDEILMRARCERAGFASLGFGTRAGSWSAQRSPYDARVGPARRANGGERRVAVDERRRLGNDLLHRLRKGRARGVVRRHDSTRGSIASEHGRWRGPLGERDCSALVGTENLGADLVPCLNRTRCRMVKRVMSADRYHGELCMNGGDECRG